MPLFDDWPEIVRTNVPLAPLTWFKLGGTAEYLIEPRTEDELVGVVRRCRETNTPLRFLGLGANVIVNDNGVKGAVVRLTADHFTQMIVDGDRVTAGAGADLTKLVLATVKKGLAGLENIAGIPGTVGGGIAMNCGGRYGEIGTAVRSVRVIGRDGEIYERDHDDMDFGYRRSALGDDCVLSVSFQLHKDDPATLDHRFREIWMYKQNTQPPLGCQSVGCIFRNPDGRSAGQLIDQAGLKGRRIGTAYVSDRHANFVLADIGGRAGDVLELIDSIIDTVNERFGIRLEPEVKIW
ncbi:MAG: UDP-N-acetylmuramate dehydrogenase [Planctomycetes bacterium]|nr:UDP-N-acetylmuramate dehydrogenase [Planctomycetota bacterium]